MRNMMKHKMIWVGTGLVLLLSASQVSAGCGPRHGYYYGGRCGGGYGRLGYGFAAGALTAGVIASTYPRHHTVVVRGYPYYYSPVYYPPYPAAYVVAPPTVVTQPLVIAQPTYAAQPVVYAQPEIIQPDTRPALPLAQNQTPAPSGNMVTTTTAGEFCLNIPNSDGATYTQVVIREQPNGYVGPQGEFYPEFPKVAQLKAMYCK